MQRYPGSLLQNIETHKLLQPYQIHEKQFYVLFVHECDNHTDLRLKRI